RNLEAYVDDMVIKSKSEHEMIMDIAKTFDNLWQINMKMNLKKCLFGRKSEVPGIHGNFGRNKGKSQEDKSGDKYAISQNPEGNAKSKREASSAKPVPLQISETILAIL
ncbi:hypothetical protein Tco_0915774, partial [Tanacetum coccineum]